MLTPEPLQDSAFRFEGRSRNRFIATIMLLLMSIAAIVLAILLLTELATKGPSGISWSSVAFLGLGLFMALGLIYLASQIKSFSVRSGLMTLPIPIRTISGRRVKSIPLLDITAGEFTGGAGGGVTLTLKDGTQFQILYEDLPAGGKEFLERFVAARSKVRPHEE